MNNLHFRFILFNLKAFNEIVTRYFFINKTKHRTNICSKLNQKCDVEVVAIFDGYHPICSDSFHNHRAVITVHPHSRTYKTYFFEKRSKDNMRFNSNPLRAISTTEDFKLNSERLIKCKTSGKRF